MRCRMRCGDIWRCGGPIKKHVPVENVSIVGWDSTMSFEAQAQPYYVNYSIDVSPETATNKNVTIVSSNPEVINVSAYDSSTVTFSIEGAGEAEVTITSQDNPEVNTTYSVTITPPACRVTIIANNPERARRIYPSEINSVYNNTIEVMRSHVNKGNLKVTSGELSAVKGYTLIGAGYEAAGSGTGSNGHHLRDISLEIE